jgi:hypothetical protein
VDRAGHPDGSIETQTETLIARRERFTLQYYSEHKKKVYGGHSYLQNSMIPVPDERDRKYQS